MHEKLLWGPGGQRVYEDVAARAAAQVACSQHADTARSRVGGTAGGFCREEVFNQV